MNNKYVYMVMAGIAGAVWVYVGMSDYYDVGGYWLLATVIAIGMGAGNTDGDDVVSALMGAITGFIPQLISMGVFGAVGSAIHMLMVGSAFDVMELVHGLAIFVAAGAVTSVMMAYLKKSAA